MGAAPPLPPDDDSLPEGPTLPTTAPEPPAKMPRAPLDRDPQDAETTLISLINQRRNVPMDLGLRDKEHAAFSRYVLERLGPLLGSGVVAAAPPVYNAMKGGAQALGMMKDATPASMQAVKAGWSPLWGGDRPQQPAQPQPFQSEQAAQANKLYTVLRMLGLIPTPDRQTQLGSR